MHEVAVSVSEHTKAALIQKVFHINRTGRYRLSWNPAYMHIKFVSSVLTKHIFSNNNLSLVLTAIFQMDLG